MSTRNLKTNRPAIFLDRDGVLNREVGNLSNIEDFILIPKVAKAIKKINQADFYAVVITNQPVIAKGFCTWKELLDIHKKMETELLKEGAKLDAIYFCPHHPDKGFEGEVKKYKIDCNCRKPKHGMILRAAADLNIDLKKSVMIGDSTTDREMSLRAGVGFVGVKTGHGLKDNQYLFKSKPVMAGDLNSAVNKILKSTRNGL